MIKHDKIINSLMHGEPREMISSMSFKDYYALDEASADIVPPSGKPISPTAPAATQPAAGQQSRPAATAPAPLKPEADPRGVQVKNPQTGKMEWMKPSVDQSGKPVVEDKALARMKQLAGIVEDGSCGGISASGIAVAPKSMGSMNRRQPTDEKIKKEYTPEVAKTVVGDTKPNQASGELSATLAANNKKTASRTNNGFKK
jgi:hypothetical protein